MDERFAPDSGVTHPVHNYHEEGWRLFDANSTQLKNMERQRVEMLDARSKGHESNKVQVVVVRVRIRNEVRG